LNIWSRNDHFNNVSMIMNNKSVDFDKN